MIIYLDLNNVFIIIINVIIQNKQLLSTYSTFGLNTAARFSLIFDTADDLLEISDFIDTFKLPSISVGGGSNIIFCSDYPGVVIKNNCQYIDQKSDNQFTVSAGYELDKFIDFTVSKGLYGLECLSGIPGTIGGAVALNAGAYGQTIKDCLISLRIFDINTRRISSLTPTDLHYWHRTSIFREKRGNDWIILDATFRLSSKFTDNKHPKIMMITTKGILSSIDLRKHVLNLRKHLPDPKTMKNCGSFFLNPIITNNKALYLIRNFCDIAIRRYDSRHQQVSAGWLIDKAGLRGVGFGNFLIHTDHANVVINNSNDSTGKDLIKFISCIQDIVLDKFDIRIVPEPLLIGEELWQGLFREPSIKNTVRNY